MKAFSALILASLLLVGCASTEIAPIPGSITYSGQPKTKLTLSPIGSTFSHDFYDGTRVVEETYQIQPDRSLKIVRREYRAIFPD
ncbi:hypothetical protein MUU53_03690 [Rhizobium lemnae]|uniref:Transmembrane protein n=1 Tax=Rhizobium lemnae TaxID=1214924 RepID=A0ABV8E812_9HYPH|nr:hypothetical protein [Rhizobium lemnae]MCJ8507009.1 hypothetical protein [Rhizobium lemnae]